VEPTNIYVCPALESGNRKTAVLSALTAPLYELERKLQAEYEPQVRPIQSERKTRLAQIEKLRKAAEPGDNQAILQILQMESELPEEVMVPQIILQDVTPEALGKMMGDQNGRVALFSDEGGIFDIFGRAMTSSRI
jgi:putative DNA primase/helicase